MKKQKKASKIRATNNEIECTQIDLLLKTLKKNSDEKNNKKETKNAKLKGKMRKWFIENNE